MQKQNPLRITPTEMAKALGKTNPEPIRAALRSGTYPIGMAYKIKGKWIYDIPRGAFEEFLKSGKAPD